MQYDCHGSTNDVATLLLTDPVFNDRLRRVLEDDGDSQRLITDGGEDSSPLDRIFHEEEPPETVVIEDAEMDAEAFIDTLEELADAASDLSRLADDLQALRQTGLREEDVVDLLYGRNSGLTKTTIETVIETIDDVRDDTEKSTGREQLLRRLVADLSNETQADTQEVFDELSRLHERYGRNSGEQA